MFKNLFKKSEKPTEEVKEVVTPCTCEGDNEHCDLISQLRVKQELRKKIKDEIETLDRNSNELIYNFISLLKKFETNGLCMDTRYSHLFNDRNVEIIKYVISYQCSSGDIFRITEELKTYKNRDDIICDKQRALSVVEDDIKDIKSKLGIE